MEDLCVKCGQIVDRKNFRRHLKTHNSVEYKCYSCDKTYASMDHLKRHEKNHETILNESLSELGMFQERYFNVDALVGNRECKNYTHIK